MCFVLGADWIVESPDEELIYNQDHLFSLASTKESLDIKRRHAFMLAGTLLNEYSDLAAAALEFKFHRLIDETDVATETKPKWGVVKIFNMLQLH